MLLSNLCMFDKKKETYVHQLLRYNQTSGCVESLFFCAHQCDSEDLLYLKKNTLSQKFAKNHEENQFVVFLD